MKFTNRNLTFMSVMIFVFLNDCLSYKFQDTININPNVRSSQQVIPSNNIILNPRENNNKILNNIISHVNVSDQMKKDASLIPGSNEKIYQGSVLLALPEKKI